MSLSLFAISYFAIGSLIASYAFYHGAILRPAHRDLAFPEYVVLAFAALGVGAIWVLFVPGLVAVAARALSGSELGRRYGRQEGMLGTGTVRARG